MRQYGKEGINWGQVRHETAEMHRQWRIALDALKQIEHSARCNSGGFLRKDQLLDVVRQHGEMAKAAIRDATPPGDSATA